MKIACLTDMGRSRDINEDNCIFIEINRYWSLLMVADGMGGHNAGEVASSIAVDSISCCIKKKMRDDISTDEIIELIKESIQKANSDIYKESISNASCSGMGTTVTLAMISNDLMIIGHVGDSRAYVLKEAVLCKITNDHSLVAELVKNGTITEIEAQHHPQKNIITRALGTDDNIEVDIEFITIDGESTVLLCTDGLTNMVNDSEIESVLINYNVNDAARKLIDLANEQGGFDNITVAIARAACPDSEVKQ